MDSPEVVVGKLDSEFNQMLADMKPHVMRLPHKSERQRCALWIKKFCEPPASGITGRKNRNMYAQLLLHMLRRGVLEGPFTSKPDSGPLATLPAYMSIYFDDMKNNTLESPIHRGQIPDWVSGELGSELASLGGSLRSSTLEPAASSTFKFSSSAHDRDRFTSGLSSPSRSRPAYSSVEFGQRDFSPSGATGSNYKDDKDSIFTVPGDEWRKTFDSTFATSKTGSSLRDDTAIMRMHEKELDMKSKMLEAKFQEEKLRLQQKHDATVQKILDRKNSEIEDLKSHYRSKAKEYEETSSKLEKKVGNLQKEVQSVREHKDKQIEELKNITEETAHTRQNEFEKRLHDSVAEFEQEKFELQKQHTKNIQDLLEDTNTRLVKMEEEYNHQAAATGQLIKDLEARVQQLTVEAETTSKLKNQLERDKIELEGKVERLQADVTDYRTRHDTLEKDSRRQKEEMEHEMRSLKNKSEAHEEFLKQEQNLQAVKSADTISDLEQHVSQLKQALETAEQHRQRQLRESEQSYQQDKNHLENLHEKKIRSVQNELEQMEQENQKRIHKLEQTMREKEEEIVRLVDQNKHQMAQSEQALHDFKVQVECNSNKVYDDLKKQMEKVESDLGRSKQLREKQAKDSQKQLEEERMRQLQLISEIKMSFEQEKAQMLRDFQMEKDALYTEKEQELEKIKEATKLDLGDMEKRASDRHTRDANMMGQLENQVQELREQLVQANQLRKQQLVELGLLREEEKQKMQHEHEAQVGKLRSELEQLRLDMEKDHSTEMEEMLEKTNARLKEIEKEYGNRSIKASETIRELQKTIQQMREEQHRQKDHSEQQLAQTSARLEEEKRKLKQQHSSVILALQQETENQKSKYRQLERKISQQEQDYEEKLTSLRGQYEGKMKGMMPSTLRQELEDTITSLKSQVISLQQRAQVLQEELDIRSKYPTSQLGTSFATSLGSSTSIKSNA